MAVTKSREELVRLSWLTELRRQGHRQCVGVGLGPSGCALQMLARMRDGFDDDLIEAAESAGLSYEQAWQVMALNDGNSYETLATRRWPAISVTADHQHSFAEIADVVAGWFPS